MSTLPRLARPISALALAACLTLLAACSGSSDQTRTYVATTGMIADALSAIVGDRAEVITLIGPGSDPHLFTPDRSHTEQLLGADAIFLNGLHLEGKLGAALDKARSAGRKVIPIGERIDRNLLLKTEGADDPHLWMDPLRWKAAVEVIRDALIEADPAGAATFRRNADAYLLELDALHAEMVAMMAPIPESSRVLVTAHDAFGYFGDRFGFELVSIQGISTESQASVRDIEDIVARLVRDRIGAVFIESTINPATIRSLIEGAARKGHTVRIGGELYGDAMGAPGSPEGTYTGMMRHNARIIAGSLGAVRSAASND